MVSYSERGNRTVRLHDSFLNDQDPRLLLYLKSCRFMRFPKGSRLRPLRGWVHASSHERRAAQMPSQATDQGIHNV